MGGMKIGDMVSCEGSFLGQPTIPWMITYDVSWLDRSIVLALPYDVRVRRGLTIHRLLTDFRVGGPVVSVSKITWTLP